MFWLRKLFCFQCKFSQCSKQRSVFCPLTGSTLRLLFSTSHLPSAPCKLMQTPFLPPAAELFRLPGQGLKQCQPLTSQSYLLSPPGFLHPHPLACSVHISLGCRGANAVVLTSLVKSTLVCWLLLLSICV
uniref:Uncharacterized protein n=1 Tax=Saimiri boliviensis boliviensis TaxID=39432 RepID=A0A2K6SU81_SAIBB